MNLHFRTVDYSAVQKNFSEDLIKSHSEACGGNDGSCEGGACETLPTDSDK